MKVNCWTRDEFSAKLESLSEYSFTYILRAELNVSNMVFFGRKEKLEDRRLLASIDAMNGGVIHQIDNGKSLPSLAPQITQYFAIDAKCSLRLTISHHRGTFPRTSVGSERKYYQPHIYNFRRLLFPPILMPTVWHVTVMCLSLGDFQTIALPVRWHVKFSNIADNIHSGTLCCAN